MTKEDAIKFMREHFSEDVMWDIVNAIAEHEREECAKIAQNKISKTWSAPQSPKEWWELASQTIAIEIRERKKK